VLLYHKLLHLLLELPPVLLGFMLVHEGCLTLEGVGVFLVWLWLVRFLLDG